MKFETLECYNLHMPYEVRLFSIDQSNIKLWNDKYLVYDVREDDMILRHYSFYNQWFEINCSFQLDGKLLGEQGPIEWSFNCDICSPCFSEGNKIFNVDLELDVLVNQNGKDYIIIDEDDFEDAVNKAWITEKEQVGAKQGLNDLKEIIDSGNLIHYLNEICPFKDVINCTKANPMEKFEISEIQKFKEKNREQCYGKRRL
ncbi:DUF402 domain-containing protein [Bacillus solitudinis]|uniref:DUF402 domain-containing protein n=1 Tax=Bacillus solitudinis TaxID=2014074 RepID=UPI000C2474CA|nr:DUF402 domain-containing protein [Bacillus solitudinis]